MSASLWDPASPAGSAASLVPFTPTATIAADDVQAAIEETDTENRALLTAFKAALLNSGNVAEAAALVAYNPALAYAAGFGQFLNYTFGRTARETAVSVTPVNYQYREGDVRRYGAVGDGTTVDDTAFANWALVVSGRTGYIPIPSVAYRLNTGILFDALTNIIGENKDASIIHWYGAGVCFRSVGTVNVSGSNKQIWRDFQIRTKGNASPQDCIALLWGGTNILQRLRLTWDSTNRPRYCLIADQQALLTVEDCHFEGYSGFGILGPNTGEYTTYGTSTSSYVTVANISRCQFNSIQGIAVALDIGETVHIHGCNFNATPTSIRLGNITAFSVRDNYFERTVTDFSTSTNHGPALSLASTSAISGSALTVTNRTEGSFGPDNHVEMYQSSIQSGALINEGIIEIRGGFAGTLNIVGNEFAQPFSHCCYVVSGTATRINYENNFFINESNSNGVATDVFVDPSATANIYRSVASQFVLPSTVAEINWGGQKFIKTSAVPTTSNGSVLEGDTVSPGDIILLTTGHTLQVIVGGTFGGAQASTASISSGGRIVTLSGSDGTLKRGSKITIAGVSGIKTILQVYNDGVRKLLLDTAADATVAGAAITYSPPTLGPTGLFLADGVTAPAAVSGLAQMYVDTADGDLKVVFGNGVVKTIVVDT